MSLPSPGSQRKVSSPEPDDPGVVAPVAVDEVVAGAAEEHLDAVAAVEVVVAAAAVDGHRLVGECDRTRSMRNSVTAAAERHLDAR